MYMQKRGSDDGNECGKILKVDNSSNRTYFFSIFVGLKFCK